jgi:hypothetical protein
MHFQLFKNHLQIVLVKDKDKESYELFTGLCDEHIIELKYFCNNHNSLCCSECLVKIKKKST